MSSKVEICNLALGNIGAGSINSIDEANKPAQVCKQRYDRARRLALEGADWGFAHSTVALALLEEKPREWVYAYSYPTTCLKIRRLLPNISVGTDRTVLYRLEDPAFRLWLDRHQVHYERGLLSDGQTSVIMTNEPEAYCSFTRDIEDPNLFTESFEEALAAYLASVIAIPIVGRKEGLALRKDWQETYRELAAVALADDANERNPPPPPEPDSVRARNR